MNPTIVFLLSFLGLNFLIFLPNWMVGRFALIDNSSNKSNPNKRLYYFVRRWFFQRYSNDFFRFLLEIELLSFAALAFEGIPKYWLQTLFVVLSVFAFAYITYISIITKIFKKMVVLSNDINFAKTGYTLYRKKMPILFVLVFALLVFVGFVSSYLSGVLIDSAKQITQPYFLIGAIIFGLISALLGIVKVKYEFYYYCVSFSIFWHLYSNLRKNVLLKKSLTNLNHHIPYSESHSIVLQQKPNVILIFLESYGSFALNHNPHSIKLKQKLQDLQQTVSMNQWYSASTMSRSPVSSGGSWLSHSSIYFGTHVKDIAAHELIFSLTDYANKLNSLPRFFERNKYSTLMTSSISYRDKEVNWQKVQNAYPFEQLMLIHEFDYTGKRVEIFGELDTLPDEYLLNFALQKAKKKSPFFLSITPTNSHYKFISPIKALDNWEDYNKIDFELTNTTKNSNLDNYFTAMHYQFDYIQNLIQKNTLQQDTILLLIGDHQPPLITPANADKNTPIHIIAKNPDFVNAFKDFDYSDGMLPNESSNTKHEAFFSQFLFAMNRAYGVNPDLDLPIYNNGIDLY